MTYKDIIPDVDIIILILTGKSSVLSNRNNTCDHMLQNVVKNVFTFKPFNTKDILLIFLKTKYVYIGVKYKSQN